jgi:hypothetical protein
VSDVSAKSPPEGSDDEMPLATPAQEALFERLRDTAP